MFFCSTMNVVSLPFFSLSWFSLSVVSPHKSLHPLVILLLRPSFMLFETLLPLVIFSLLFFLLLLPFVFFIEALQTQWHVSINIAMFESASSFSFQILISTQFVFFVVVFSPHACWKVSVKLLELSPAASFTCASVASLISMCCRMYFTTLRLSLTYSFLSRLSTAHSRCDEFFDCRFSVWSSTSSSMSWYLIYLRDPLWHVLPQSGLWLTLLCLMWMQYLTYLFFFFWWNLSSAPVDQVIFLFLPLNSFLNMFADLTYVFISSSLLK